jgi:hypothetical protein
MHVIWFRFSVACAKIAYIKLRAILILEPDFDQPMAFISRRIMNICMALLGLTIGAADKMPAADYIQLLQQGINSCHSQMEVITDSAEKISSRTVMGGRLWAAGRQKDFISEAVSRAGGLVCIKPLDINSIRSGDSILYAVPGVLNSADIMTIQAWNSKGIYVTAFASGSSHTDFKNLDMIALIRNSGPGMDITYKDQKKLCPLDTVINVVNLWTWTGEFASAALRQGKMPVFFQSVGIDTKRQRYAKYSGQTFHNDFKIQPVARGVFGKAYLDALLCCISKLREGNDTAMRSTAVAWRAADPSFSKCYVIGHMFPVHLQDARAPQPISIESVESHDQKTFSSFHGRFFLYLGYQYPPQALVEQAAKEHFALSYITVRPASPRSSSNIIYMDPAWPLPDACVTVPGYDIPILPASGVIDAAIYWSILAQFCK